MSVRVVARIRPLLEKELDRDIIVRAESSEEGKAPTVVKIPSPKNEAEEFSFAFNSVYDLSTTQETLFTAEVAPHVKSLFQGLDVTIFAYGVTGTGKTHTMRGGLKLAERGVIPRMLSAIFRRAKKIAKDSAGETTVDVALSYYEIYNDKVFDLLEPPEKRTAAGLPLREKDNRTFVVGLSERSCSDLKDFERLYIESNNNRVTAATKLNAHSSRSHAILRVKLTQTTAGVVRESTASAIDLAGSEDNRRTDNGKERLVESAAINKSLFVLSQCIDAIGRGDKRIPYRESKMTRILSLGQNNGITIMILNLAPIRSYHLDTLSSLNVSSRAKRIEVREIENEVVFKHVPPRTATAGCLSGPPLHRQPLRPLANAHNAHNMHSGAVTASRAAERAEKEKPVKAFSVYTDRSKPAAPLATRPLGSSSTAGVLRRLSPNKRKSDADDGTIASRPSKLVRPAQTVPRQIAGAPTAPAITQAQIEAMVERKVQEVLAARAEQSLAAHTAPAQRPPVAPATNSEISEAVQRRLDELERRIEDNSTRAAGGADPRSDGLRLLLLARQHKERGDDEGALRTYESALPFFPGQAKLLGKIERLRAKLGTATASAVGDSAAAISQSPAAAAPPRKRAVGMNKKKAGRAMLTEESDLDYQVPSDADVDASGSEESPILARGRHTAGGAKRKPARRLKVKATPLLSDDVFDPEGAAAGQADDEAEQMTPRKRQLLAIVNSRDLALIRGLAGFGAKKARDLVENLDLLGGEGARNIASLAQLCAVPGIGSRTVERAYEGLGPAGSIVAR